MLKNKKGHLSMEVVIIACLAIMCISLLSSSLPHFRHINKLQYEGFITSKEKSHKGKFTNYYIYVESPDKKSITFSVSSSEYKALEAGYYIKYYSYQNKGKNKIHYNLGVPESPGTIILVTKEKKE